MKKKFFITTTIPDTLVFFNGNLAFLNRTFDVCAISSQNDDFESFCKSEGIRMHIIPMRRPIHLIKDLVSLVKFIWLLFFEKPSVIHGNTPKASLLSMLAGKITGIKVRIYMCHGLRYQGTSGIMRWLLVQMEKLTCACATEVICVSNGVRTTLIDEGITEPHKAKVIHYGSASGLDLKKFDILDTTAGINLRKELGVPQSDFVFVFVGRLVTDKGVNELVSSFVQLQSLHSGVHLILVGAEDGKLNPISSNTKRLILESPNIHSIGVKYDIRPYLQCANAFVLPSYREGFGMVLIEAGAMRLPCITTDVPGCNEIIIHGINGEIIPARDEQALFSKMMEWFENPEKVASMAKNSRSLVETRYDQNIVWNKLLTEYERLLSIK